MIPPVPRSGLFPLRAEVQGSSARLRTPRSLYVRRGILAVLLLPIALFLLCLVVFAGFVEDATPGVESAFTAVFATLSGAGVLYGLVLVAASGPLAARTEVVFDAERRTVRRSRDGAEVMWTAVTAVRARQRQGLSGFWTLELVGHDGATLLSLHDRLQSTHGNDLRALALFCAAGIGVPADVPAALATTDALVASDNTAAMLCYLPIQGVFLIAALYYVFAARHRPFVRFAAIQSLMQFGASIVVLAIVLGAGATPVVLLDDGPARVVAIVLLVLLLVAFLVWNLGAHIKACSDAHKGRVWIMPWLRPLVQRWAP